MNSQKIEKLVEKYFDGETSSQDELLLKKFFLQDNIPRHLRSLKSYFNYLGEEVEAMPLNEDFDNKFFETIKENENSSRRFSRRITLYIASGVAACILILIGLFTKFDRIVDTYNDPEVAYQEVKNALVYFSAKFNSGIEDMDQVAKLDEGLNKASKMTYFNKGVEEASKASKLYEAKKQIFNQ